MGISEIGIGKIGICMLLAKWELAKWELAKWEVTTTIGHSSGNSHLLELKTRLNGYYSRDISGIPVLTERSLGILSIISHTIFQYIENAIGK